MSRIQPRFAELKQAGRAGLVTFVMAGDPDMGYFDAILAGMAKSGADVLEIGMPFSDPMADGPAIQAAGLRALKSGTKLAHVLAAVSRFRKLDDVTPIVLMGYYNPIYSYDIERFAKEASSAGVDGVILVDLPPEEVGECLPFLREHGLDLIRLTTPTSDDARLPKVLEGASGFVYHVAIAGITGTRSAETGDVAEAVARIRRHTDLPVAVGFGIRTPEQAAAIARIADAAVVGSAIVDTIAKHAEARENPAEAVHAQVAALATGIHGAR
ncbi:MAG TPA: tryptophan synthase subunit alpha [Stellaceae bacterium]|nr:tryptophan synthase subunit alpha [Stellaceae bacterium]